MEKREFSSIEEIDAALDEEFSLSEDDELELDELEDEDESDDDEEDMDEKVEDDEEIIKKEKPNKQNQQEYAFAKLREEKLQAENKAKQEAEFMRKLAKASGYGEDVESYRKDLESRLVEEEARQHGITPEVYQELADAKAKLEKYEKEKVETERTTKSQKFLNTINQVLEQYDVDSKAMSKELFQSLEDAGYSIETLLSIPQPEFLIRGVLYEKLSKATLKDNSIKNSVETKKLKSSAKDVKSVDELIEEEMVAYAKSRGLKYVK